MFNIGLGELLFVAILVLIFIGPERLPQVLRQIGEVVYKLRQMAAQISNEFGEDLEPIRELQTLAGNLDPRRQIGRVLDVSADAAAGSAGTAAKPETAAAAAAPARPNPMAMLTQARQADAPPAAPPAAASDTEA